MKQKGFDIATINKQWKYKTKSFHTDFLHISKTKYPL